MRGRQQTGVALVLVLWTVVLLTIIASSFAFSMRAESDIAGNTMQRARAQAIAGGALRIGVLRLLTSDLESRQRADGVPQRVTIDGQVALVSVQAEDGFVDLNRAPPDLIRAVVNEAVQGDAEVARAITDRIIDWRDTNRNRRQDGAEDPAYAAAGKSYGSRDGPFVSEQELGQILGLTPAILARLLPLVTVHSGRPQVNPTVAPPAVLEALPGSIESQVAAFVAARDDAARTGAPPTMEFLTGTPGHLSAPTAAIAPKSGVYRVRAQAIVGDALAQQTATVRVRVSRNVRSRTARRAGRRLPYSVITWSDLPGAVLSEPTKAVE